MPRGGSPRASLFSLTSTSPNAALALLLTLLFFILVFLVVFLTVQPAAGQTFAVLPSVTGGAFPRSLVAA